MTVQGVPPPRPSVVQVRLIGAEEDVKRAIDLLAQVGAQFSRPHRGRSGQDWLAYGTLVVERADGPEHQPGD